MTAIRQAAFSLPWHEANLRYLRQEVARLRLLLRRRALWLSRQAAGDPLAVNPQDAGAREDPETAAIGDSLAALAEDIARRKRAFADSGREAPLDALSRQFRLTEFERDVLLLCLAPELEADPNDDANQRYPSPHLAMQLTAPDGEPWLSARDSFLPSAPLRRFRLIEVEPSAQALGARAIRLTDRVADYLLGVNHLDEEAAAYLRPAPEALLAPSHERQAEDLRQWIDSAVREGRRPLLNLVGPAGAGKQSLARAVCDRLGVRLHVLQVAQLEAAGAERRNVLRLLEREALLLDTAVYADLGDWAASAPPGAAAAAGEAIEDFDALLIVASHEPWKTAREALTVRVGTPDPADRRALWTQALGGAAAMMNGQLDGLVEQFELGPGAIAEVVARATERVRLAKGAGGIGSELWRACREQAGRNLEQLAQRIEPRYTWDDIVLPPDVQAQLRELASQAELRRRVYEDWGFGEKLSRGRGISALFSGPSGTGKTMAAEVLASHLELDLFRIDLASVVSKYIGETEKNLRKIFDAAEQSGAVLFFDEADALFGKRVEVKEGHDRYANIEINYLLQRMEDYRGLAVLATNKKSSMDEAFLRRLRFLVEFPAPDAALRRQIWQKAFPRKAEVEALDYGFLSRLEIAGGNIRNIVVNAAFLAASKERPISMEHVLHAARREYAKIDKLVGEAEFGPYYARMRR